MKYRHRGLKESDVFVASYPRSGNTWLRCLLGDLLTDADLSFEQIDRVIPTIGLHRGAPRLLPGDGRLVKTHEPYRPAYRRAIYIVRDVRDVAVSYHKWIQGHTTEYSIYGADYTDMDRFLPAWLAGELDGYGSWEAHVRGWRSAFVDGAADLLWLRYEDLRTHPLSTLRTVAAWIGVQASDERLDLALGRNTLTGVRDKEARSVNYTTRQYHWAGSGVGKGSTGGWRDVFQEHHLRQLELPVELLPEVGYSIAEAHRPRAGDQLSP